MSILLSKVFVGLPKRIGDKNAVHPMGREWESAIFKEPVEGPVWVGKTKLDGDGQADLKNHGGWEKAVFAYHRNIIHIGNGNTALQKWAVGGMGENLPRAHISEEVIAIGDAFEIGGAIVQVSQPRQPCWKPARRFKMKNLALLIQDTGRTGWYFRVLQEGHVEEGQTFTLVDRPAPEWTIEQCNNVMHFAKEEFGKSRTPRKM